MPWHSASLPKHFESYSAMQKKALQILEGVSSITCDQMRPCFASRSHWHLRVHLHRLRRQYGSIFGDGSKVEVDLCQQCLQATLGHWLRVSESDRRESALARALEAFDPARHGGEAFSREDGASNAVLPNRPASNLVGFRPPAEPGAMSVDIPTDREQSLCTDRDPEQVFGLIERADETGALVRRIIGFPHIEFSATTPAALVQKLRAYVEQLQASLLGENTQSWGSRKRPGDV